MAVLSIEDLRVTFVRGEHRVPAVRGVSFAVGPGRTLAIVGESGSGKTVSLLAATGLLGGGAVVEGRARHAGVDLIGLSPRQLRRVRGKQIGFVFQDPLSNLHPLKTIGQQLGDALGAHARMGRAARRRRAVELLDEVGIAEPHRRIDDHPIHFSGGMRQRAMIAAAIAHEPAVLIADEATTALDVTVQASILRLLQRLQREHEMALVFVSHDLAVVSEIADDVVVMRQGVVVEDAPVARITADPQHPYTRALLGATRRRRPEPRPVRDGGGGPPLLAVAGVSHDFRGRGGRSGARRVLHDVSFELGVGEVVGLVGESGSGKTTIGRIVAGLLRPTAGRVTIDGAVCNEPGRGHVRLDAAARSRVQVVFQDPYGSLNPRRRIGASLAEPFRIHRTVPAARVDDEVHALLRRVELPPALASRYPAHLSGGQRQRVALARALALGPSLVVADEPVSALDVTTQAQILELIERLRHDLGVSFLFISHDLSVVEQLSDRVLVLRDGRIVEAGGTAAVFDDPRHPYTQLLIDSIPGRGRANAADAAVLGA